MPGLIVDLTFTDTDNKSRGSFLVNRSGILFANDKGRDLQRCGLFVFFFFSQKQNWPE